MRVHIFGSRGSRPSPGAEYTRYGGHTSCIALGHGEADAPLILDAGTGITQVPKLIGAGPYRGAIVVGHLHWDHTHGVPFFSCSDHPDSDVEFWMPAQGDPLEVLTRSMSPPHFPIAPTDLRGTWRFGALEEGTRQIQGFEVLALEIPHKGGRTFGYRVSDGESSLAYLSDHSPIVFGEGPDGFGEYHDAAMRLAAGVDLLIHDAQYTAGEFARRRNWGHSTIDYAVGLGERADAGRVLLFHHDPFHNDAFLDAQARELDGSRVEFAREGVTFDL